MTFTPYFLVHSCKYHPLQQLCAWDLQCTPISFSLCMIISFKLSHPSLPSSDAIVNHYNRSHVFFLSDMFFLGKSQLWLIPTLHLPCIFTQPVYVWQKTNNHAVYYFLNGHSALPRNHSTFPYTIHSPTLQCNYLLPFLTSSSLQPQFGWVSHFLFQWKTMG